MAKLVTYVKINDKLIRFKGVDKKINKPMEGIIMKDEFFGKQWVVRFVDNDGGGGFSLNGKYYGGVEFSSTNLQFIKNWLEYK